MKKTLPILCLLFLLSACSESRYYFNKRIDHANTETTAETLPIRDVPMDLNEPVAAQEGEMSLPVVEPLHNPTEASETTEGPVSTATEPAPAVKALDLPVGKTVAETQSETFVHESVQQKVSFHQAAQSGGNIGGWGIFFLVVGGICLITFLIALLLGYTVGQSLLYVAIVLLILIIVLLYLLMGGGNPDWFSSNNDDDDDNDDD